MKKLFVGIIAALLLVTPVSARPSTSSTVIVNGSTASVTTTTTASTTDLWGKVTCGTYIAYDQARFSFTQPVQMYTEFTIPVTGPCIFQAVYLRGVEKILRDSEVAFTIN